MKSLLLLSGIFWHMSVSAQPPHRAVEGGGSVVVLDTITPLSTLIEKLRYPVPFVETGKMYWIGYPDLMYSIAACKGRAIAPLVAFIYRAPAIDAKQRAILTLHLIGLESQVKGRFHEEFKNENARRAMLQFMNQYGLHRSTMYLLMRDPWRMDIAYYMDYLAHPHKDYSKVLHALNRFYMLKDRPFSQEIPGALRKRNVLVTYAGTEVYDDIAALIALKKSLLYKIYIDTAITNSDDWKDCLRRIKEGKKLQKDYRSAGAILFRYHGLSSSFLDFDSKYFYTIDQKGIRIYSPSRARQIWLAWWQKHKTRKLRWEHIPGYTKAG